MGTGTAAKGNQTYAWFWVYVHSHALERAKSGKPRYVAIDKSKKPESVAAIAWFVRENDKPMITRIESFISND